MAEKKQKTADDLISIIDGYAFDYDGMTYTLYEVGTREAYIQRTKIKTGETKDYADAIGYYSSVNAMMQSVLDKATKRNAANAGVKSIGDYLEIMKQVKDEIISSIENTAI